MRANWHPFPILLWPFSMGTVERKRFGTSNPLSLCEWKENLMIRNNIIDASYFRPSGCAAPGPVRQHSATSSRSPSVWLTSWSTPPRDRQTATPSRRRTSWSVSPSPTDKRACADRQQASRRQKYVCWLFVPNIHFCLLKQANKKICKSPTTE